MEDRDLALCRKFIGYAKNVMEKYPQIRHAWSIDADGDHCILDIPSSDPEGFPITVEVYPDEITVFGQGTHAHFVLFGNHDSLIESVMGLVRDLLSPSMRIREHLSAGKPYRWDTESLVEGEWKRKDTT
ncbi:MAG: hypothetical protein HC904_17265, partial [Blastochloris sp.]|nr:hypothetical protein [Blastochloris sp.]